MHQPLDALAQQRRLFPTNDASADFDDRDFLLDTNCGREILLGFAWSRAIRRDLLKR